MIKGPLRYPGGKTRAIPQILRQLPADFAEYREPMIGGGSVFIHLRQAFPEKRFWINDINPEVYSFWKTTRDNVSALISRVRYIKANYLDGRSLFYSMRDQDAETLSELERAVRFFVLNRISFSGTVDAGGYSQAAFEDRFTDSSIERLGDLGRLMNGVRVTNLDYRLVLKESGMGVFIFLDPPYLVATKSRLYGKNGVIHATFDHSAFASAMRKCKHKWLITYDDSPEIEKKFRFANIFRWELQYGMNNYKQGKAEKGRELFITNYKPLIGRQGKVLEPSMPRLPQFDDLLNSRSSSVRVRRQGKTASSKVPIK